MRAGRGTRVLSYLVEGLLIAGLALAIFAAVLETTARPEPAAPAAYAFTPISFRARGVRAIDGDTAEAIVDQGFHTQHRGIFRFVGINCPEVHDKDPAKREAAARATAFTAPRVVAVPPAEWNLRIVVREDPDDFGRWLAEIFYLDGGIEKSLNQELVLAKLCVPYDYRKGAPKP